MYDFFISHSSSPLKFWYSAGTFKITVKNSTLKKAYKTLDLTTGESRKPSEYLDGAKERILFAVVDTSFESLEVNVYLADAVISSSKSYLLYLRINMKL